MKGSIKRCRYYKGEEICPFNSSTPDNQIKSMLWFYERCYVNNPHSYQRDVREYKAYGLEYFSTKDNVPITLKAILLNRYAKSCWSFADAIEPFKQFYKKYYPQSSHKPSK